MQSINVLTINREPESERDLLKIVEKARRYFPTEAWDDVMYLGKLSLEHDFEIATSGESVGALLLERLIKRIEKKV